VRRRGPSLCTNHTSAWARARGKKNTAFTERVTTPKATSAPGDAGSRRHPSHSNHSHAYLASDFPIENSARISSSIPQARTCGSPTGPWKRGRCTDAEAAAREGPDPGEPAFDEVPSGQLCGPQPLPSDEHLPDGPFSTTSGTLAVGKEPRSHPSLPIRAEDQSAAGVGLSPRSEWRSSAYRARRLTTPRRGKIRTSSKAGKMLSDSITLTTRT